jgi:hypothetical protein
MSESIKLHNQHGLAPALTFCRICGKDTNELALLGASADTVMREVQRATGKKETGYQEYGHNRIPSQRLCDECMSYLKGGMIIIAGDTHEYLRLTSEMVDTLIGKVADAKGRCLDFNAIRGKVVNIPKAFWYADGDNIRLRDPQEWTE